MIYLANDKKTELTTENETVDTSCSEHEASKHCEELKINYKFEKTLGEVDSSKKVYLGEKIKKHTLVLDIDNTLVYSEILSVSGNKTTKTEEMYELRIQIRPYAVALLETLSKLYEIVLFTAGVEEYAKDIQKRLDPKGSCITMALGRSSCMLIKDVYYVKDLRILADRDLKDILIVDDQVVSFAFQLSNGIPIIPYIGDKNDNELLYLDKYLQSIHSAEDISEANSSYIKLC